MQSSSPEPGPSEMAPPWAHLPHYHAFTIGWRMGQGEYYLIRWEDFLKGLGSGVLAYLQRHDPAPFPWAERIWATLHPDDPFQIPAHRAELEGLGLIASDAGYRSWLKRPSEPPWIRRASPELAARHDTRSFWYWSRRGGWDLAALPLAWREATQSAAVDGRQGLQTLARGLCSGRVVAPWELDLSTSDFVDSFAEDLGYVDAFRLWAIEAIDDRAQWEAYLKAEPPASWQNWVEQHILAGL